jgi:tetratricopeptide (TPR) repeat protein
MRPRSKKNSRKGHVSGSEQSKLFAWGCSHANLTFLLISGLWVALLYGPGACGPFLYDDISGIQNNPALRSWAGTLHYFYAGDPFTLDLRSGGGTSWRPLMWLTLSLDRHLSGVNPCGFHTTSLILHWMSGVLCFILLRRMKARTALSAVVCLLWLGLPINSEAVEWISGRSYPLMFVFLALSLLAADSWLKKETILPLLLYFAASLMAALSNEEGILALPLAALLLTYFSSPVPRRRWFVLGAAGAASGGIYFVARESIHAHLPAGSAAFSAIGTTVFRYVHWMVLPLHMSIERSTDTPLNRISATGIAALAGLAGLLVLIYWLRRRIPLASFGFAWMLIALLPFCGIVPVYQGMAERYAYLASFGLVLAFAAVAWQVKRPKRAASLSLLFVWGIWGAWRLRARVLEWNDPISLYQASLEATPKSTKLLYNLGGALEASGRFSEAAENYRKILAYDPQYVPAIVGMGNIDQQTGDPAQAEQEYLQAMAIDPSDENVFLNLGVLLVEEGKMDRAIQELSRATALAPFDPTAFYDLGGAYQKEGRNGQATQMYTRVLELKPGDADASANLQTLQGQGDSPNGP